MTFKTCKYEGCDAVLDPKNPQGWLIRKGDDVWCINHLPEWYWVWRERVEAMVDVDIYPDHKTRTQANLLRRAFGLSRLSGCTVKHGAIVAIGPRILATAVNTWRNEPENCSNPVIEASFHAERNVLAQLKSHDLSKATLYSARVMLDGTKGYAKPCQFCEVLIYESGIREVFHT